MHLISSLWFFLDAHLLDTPFPKLLHPYTSLTVRKTFSKFMQTNPHSWYSFPTVPNGIPHLSAQIFLAVLDLNEIYFLLPSKATLLMVRHCQPPGHGRRPQPTAASSLLHHPGAWLSLLLSLLFPVLYSSEEAKGNKNPTTLFYYKFNQLGCNCDHPFNGLSKTISVTAVPPSPGAGDLWELTITRFAGVNQGTHLAVSHCTSSRSPEFLTNTHWENTWSLSQLNPCKTSAFPSAQRAAAFDFKPLWTRWKKTTKTTQILF